MHVVIRLVVALSVSCPMAVAGDSALSPRQTLREAKKSLSRGEFDARLGALRTIAALALEGSQPPSATITRALAKALDDKDLRVRMEAIRLLSLGQHRETAVKELSACGKGVVRTLRRFTTEAVRYRKSRRTDFLKRFPGMGTASNLGAYPQFAEAVVDGLSALDHDDAREVVESFLRLDYAHTSDTLLLASVEALLHMETQDSLEAVIESLQELQDTFKSPVEVPERLGRERVRDLGSDMRFGGVHPVKSFGAAFRPVDAGTFASVLQSLQLWAERRGLETPADAGDVKAWKKWLRGVRADLPKRLPR